MRFRGLQAAIWAGASLDELEKWELGEYNAKFMNTIIAVYNMVHLVQSHVEDAKARSLERN